MSVDDLYQNWAIVVAAVLGTGILLFVIFRAFRDSVRGRLQAAVRQLRDRERDAQAAGKSVDKRVARLDRLTANADSVPPRLAQEASEFLEDARALQRIAEDQVLIVRNQLNLIITEEYPPKRHASMRSRYLRHDGAS